MTRLSIRARPALGKARLNIAAQSESLAAMALFLSATALFATALSATALARPTPDGSTTEQPPGESPRRFGVLFWHDSPNDETALAGIRSALAELPRRSELLVRRVDSDPVRAARVWKDFEADDVDLVFALGTEAALSARAMRLETPVVFTAVTNPVVSGVADGWDASGCDWLTGNSNWIAAGTTLHVFRLAVPHLSRLGLLRSSTTGQVSAAELQAMRDWLDRTESAPKLTIVEEIVVDPDDIGAAVGRLAADHVDAIWIPIDISIYQQMDRVLAAAGSVRVPLLSSSLRGAESGAVAGVLVDYHLLGQRAVAQALRILDDGDRPGSMPIETMTSYVVVVNLAAARACGHELPLALLVHANRILDGIVTGDAESGAPVIGTPAEQEKTKTRTKEDGGP